MATPETFQSPRDHGAVPQQEDRPDGLSFYRAIARMVIGDPRKYESILNAVLEHYLHVFLDRSHDFHADYTLWDATQSFPRTQTIFEALSSLDLVLCPCGKNYEMSTRVL